MRCMKPVLISKKAVKIVVFVMVTAEIASGDVIRARDESTTGF